MDDFEKKLEEYRKKQEEERQAFLDKCRDKVKHDSGLIYHLLTLGLCQRFKLKLDWDGEPPNVAFILLNYYINNVDEEWDKWLIGDDAPLIQPIKKVKRIFPELAEIYDDELEIIKLANSLYGLELYSDDDCFNNPEYMYAFSFNFNNFKPLDVKEIKQLKDEKEVLIKYGYDVSEIDEKLNSYGLTNEQLEAI